MITDFYKSHFFILRCVELFLCMICFILTTHNYESEIAMFDHGQIFINNSKISNTTSWLTTVSLDNGGFIKLHFLSIATSGYTWVILPIILLSYLQEKEYMENGFVGILLSFFGFFTFLITGSIICSQFSGTSGYSGCIAAGVFCLFACFLFLGDCGYSLWTKLKTPHTGTSSTA